MAKLMAAISVTNPRTMKVNFTLYKNITATKTKENKISKISVTDLLAIKSRI